MAGVRGKFHWNGRDLPQELRDLPPGTYVVESVDQTPLLTEEEAEFRALRANLDQLRNELVRQGKIKAEFISILGHELRTPVTSLIGDLELFQDGRFGELPPLIARPLGSVRRNAHRLKRLVDDLLDVSRIEEGKVTLRREPVNLGEVVTDVVSELEPRAEARELHVVTHIREVEPIDADRDKLHQIVVNLVTNAIRYSPEQGEILIDVDEAPSERYPGGWARLRVRDNGVGIAEEDRQRIFDPFLYLHPANHHTSALPDSAGLGLFITKGLVDAHGGLITVDSQPDVFTEFTVLMPFKAHWIER